MTRQRTSHRTLRLHPAVRNRVRLLVHRGRPFGPTDLARLRVLDARFREIEALCRDEARALAASLRARVQDPGDALSDFEIEATVTVCRREGDPGWDEEEDNILARREYLLTRGEPGFCDGRDWNRGHDGRLRTMGPVCWMFHDFHDHNYQSGRSRDRELARVSASDLLRIGRLWVDIRAIHQWDLVVPADRSG